MAAKMARVDMAELMTAASMAAGQVDTSESSGLDSRPKASTARLAPRAK